MNPKDMHISQMRQQEIARNAEMHRRAAEITPEIAEEEEVVIEITPGKTPFIFIALQKLAASLRPQHDDEAVNGTPKHA